jgi:hypothetical protein
MSHNTLENYYKTMFSMVKHHGHDGEFLESRMVWERDIYVSMQISDARKKSGG